MISLPHFAASIVHAFRKSVGTCTPVPAAIAAYVLPTNEELQIAHHSLSLLRAHPP